MWLKPELTVKHCIAAAFDRLARPRERGLLALVLLCLAFCLQTSANAQTIAGISVNSDCDTVGGISTSSAVTLQDGLGNVLAWQDSSSATGLFIPFQNSVSNTLWTANSTPFAPSIYNSQCAPAALTVSAGTFNAAVESASSTPLPSFTFTLTNTGGSAIYLPATPYFPGGTAFFSLSSVTMIGPYSSVNLTVTINASARRLARGTYTASINFSNAAALGVVATREVVLTVVSGATHDFNGDGRSDVLLRDSNSNTVADWLMNGANIQTAIAISGLPSNWAIVGTGDFDGDGIKDILLRDANSNTVAIWEMAGGSIKTVLSVGVLPGNWSIVGTGDFDGDGKTDILIRDSNTNTVGIWEMNGGTVKAALGIGVLPISWSVAGVGSFDGDIFSDVLLRDANTNTVAIWEMNGATIKAALSVGVLPGNWSIIGIGDFNGDAKSDLLIRDSNTNTIAVWEMNGNLVQAAPSLGVLPGNWAIAGSGDFNGDGINDVLWRDSNTNTVAVWQMSTAATQTPLSVGVLAGNWIIQSLNEN